MFSIQTFPVTLIFSLKDYRNKQKSQSHGCYNKVPKLFKITKKLK